ncbi:nicotinate phosphoribosyltransferase [Dissulfuribacter thermophilus]|uniref:nicotinate phosphoribosyltransferase n=1 Tax=Dissulfuribacter thermophilus TaxID=1156395 RepID=UPI00082E5C66|nr:nicotinate phosphoribosyltransferase [Dissulfuribacter thermophilus]
MVQNSFDSPLLTDLYQLTMAQVYVEKGLTGTACFEFFVRELPAERNFLVASGIQEIINFLKNFSFSSEDLKFLESTGLFNKDFLEYLSELQFKGDVYAMDEGTVFFPMEPVLQVKAPLPLAQLLETRIINVLQYSILITSKAARVSLASRGKTVVDFGLRRAHGGEAGLLAAKSSYIGGFNGTSTVLAGKLYGIPIFGTMAHSYIQAHRNELEAFLNFARTYPQRPIFLVDTYDVKQGVETAIKATQILKKEGINPFGIRIDSGDLSEESRMARLLLDEAGYNDIKIIASGDLDEYSVARLVESNAPIDGFGVGTRVVTSVDVPYLNCAYKLVEYSGKKTFKRSKGKATLPGQKQVIRHFDENGGMIFDELVLCDKTMNTSATAKCLLKPIVEQGKVVNSAFAIEDARQRLRTSLNMLPNHLKALHKAPVYEVRINPKHFNLS